MITVSYPYTLLISYLLLHYRLPQKLSGLNNKLPSEGAEQKDDVTEPLN